MCLLKDVVISPYLLWFGFCVGHQIRGRHWNEQIPRFFPNNACRCSKSAALVFVFMFLASWSSTFADTHYVNVLNQFPATPFMSGETEVTHPVDTSANQGQAIIVADGLSEGNQVWPVTNYLEDKAFGVFNDRLYLKENARYLSLDSEKSLSGAGNGTKDIDVARASSNNVEKVVLVAGGDASDTTTWPGVSSTARFAYQVLKSRLIAPSNIYVLSASSITDWDGDGTNEVEDAATRDKVKTAIQEWSDDADRLTVYVIGAYSDEDGSYEVSPTESISALQLDGWLDYFQRSNRTVNVILEFPGSGGFVQELQPPVDRDRYTVASSAADRQQVLEEGLSFSSFFLDEIAKNKSLGEAVEGARKTIRRASGNLRQKAMIDDNNNGKANEKNVDGLSSLTRYIGNPSFTEQELLLARGLVNAIGADTATKQGKAIIVAGGQSEWDAVWPATDYLADKAFRTFEDRGFSDHNIKYLSLGPEKDVVGAGNDTNDIDIARVSSNDLENVFFDWAGENTDRLTVYMVGGSSVDESGQFRLNGIELVSASTVNSWLNELQDEDTNLHVTVILDVCYSGRFLDELEYNGDPGRRIVISSTADDEPTYFVADGRISFSEYFFNGVFQGLSILDSYELARRAMKTYQHAWIDDTQDGVYGPIVGCELGADCGPAVDGAFASTNYIAASFLVRNDSPIIESVPGDQSLGGGSSAQLWAENIDSPCELERVWCTILPPSYAVDANSGAPVMEATTRDLLWNPLTKRYETEFDGFAEWGWYTIIYYAEDICGNVSPPIQRFVVQVGFLEKAILVAGGDASDTNTWPGVYSTARFAYQVLQSLLIAPSNIYVLSAGSITDWDGDGTNEVEDAATDDKVKTAIQEWGDDADQLTVYVIGANSYGDGSYQVSPTESVSAVQLDGWLDHFQRSNRTVNVILEFPGSGGFIPELIPPQDRQRYTIASSEANRQQVLTENISFSGFLLSGISQGESLGGATRRARQTIRNASGILRQKAMIDDTNNGIANEKNLDGVALLNRYIGSPFFTGGGLPNIAEVIPDRVLTNETSLLLWASGVSDADGISNVWVEITAPTNFSGAISTRLDLTNNLVDMRWEETYGGFTTPGIYILTYYAMDRLGNRSVGLQTQIIRTDTNNYELIPGIELDRFEPDNTFRNATYSDLPVNKVHTLHVSNDCDWVRFFAISNLIYDIETIHLDTNSTIDTVIRIYREETSLFDDPFAKPAWLKELTVDESGPEEGELAGLDFPTTGFYYVQVCHAVDVEFDPGTYLLVIHSPSGSEKNGAQSTKGITVRVWDVLTRQPLTNNVLVQLRPGGGYSQSTNTDNSGTARFPDFGEGNYDVEVIVSEFGNHGPKYVHLFDPSSSNNVASNPTSAYGNPRQLGSHHFGTISYDDFEWSQFSMLQFGFIPVAYVEATLLDEITGNPVSGVGVRMTPIDAPNTAYSKFPWADYGEPMISSADGHFGTSAPILPERIYTKNEIRDGNGRYVARVATTDRTSPVAGDVLDLGEIWLKPSMGTPLGTNAIPNSWESKYGVPIGDWGKTNFHSDDDGLSNFQEYIADTDPLDSNDVFRMTRAPSKEEGEFVLTWDAAPHRIYEIYKATDFDEESDWIKVYEVINTENLSMLSWTNSGTMNEANAMHRLEIKGIARARNGP